MVFCDGNSGCTVVLADVFDGSPHGAREATKDGDPSTVLFEGPTVPTGFRETMSKPCLPPGNPERRHDGSWGVL